MMVPLTSGERVLRALEQTMPWLADKRLPAIDETSFAVAINRAGTVVALVHDTANERVREVPLSRALAAKATTDPVGFAEELDVAGPTVMGHAGRLLSAPWC